MTVIGLLVIAWVLVFGPTALRFIKEELDRRSGGSIGHFHRSLNGLDRSKYGTRSSVRVRTMSRNAVIGADTSHVNFTGKYQGAPNDLLSGDSYAPKRPVPSTQVSESHLLTLQRRRFVLLILAFTCVLTGLLGLIPSLELLWVVTVLSALLVFAYVATLRYVTALDLEKKRKLTFLQTPAAPTRPITPSVVVVGRSKAN